MATKETESNTTRGQGQSGLAASTTKGYTKGYTKATAVIPPTVVSVTANKVTATAQPTTARNNKLTGASLNNSGH